MLARALIERGVARLVYLSSTGVYRSAAGALVGEDFATVPSSDHGAGRRLEAFVEALLLADRPEEFARIDA